MNDSGERKLDDFLEQARIKSKEFYIKATQNAIEEAHTRAEQAMSASKEMAECLRSYAENGTEAARAAVAQAAKISAELTARVAEAAKEAAEAASLAMSVELKEDKG